MQKLLIAILVLLFSTDLRSQNTALVKDILGRVDRYSPGQQLYAYDTLAMILKDAQPAQALLYARKGLAISVQQKDSINQPYFLTLLGVIHKNLADIDSAIYFYQQSVIIQTANKFPQGVAGNYNNIATVYRLAGKFNLSFDYYKRALAIMRDSFKSEEHTQTIYQNIAELMIENNKKSDAMDILAEAEKYCLQNNKQTGLAHIYASRAILLKNDSTASAISYAGKATAIYKKAGRIKEYCQSLNLLGELYLLSGHYKEGLVTLNNATANAGQQGFAKEKADGLLITGKIYFKLNKLVDAKATLLGSLALYKQLQISRSLPECYKWLADVAEQEGDHKQANAYLRLYEKLDDSLNSVQLKNEFNQLQIKYNISEKERTISRLKDSTDLQLLRYQQQKLTLEKQRNQNIYLGILIVVIILFAGLFVYRYLQKKKLSARLQTALTEREILIKEVHHRVKNNLQIITSLLNLQQEQGTERSAADVISLIQDRVYTMSMIHEKLYKSENLKNISIEEYINSLCTYYRHSYNLPARQITLTTIIENPHPIVIDQLIPLGLILNELIVNSIKHAFDEKPGAIIVTCKGEKEKINFSVCDSGKGIPDHYKVNAPGSLGMQLIEGFADQLKARLVVTTVNGTCFTLVFKPIEYGESKRIDHGG